MYQEKAGTSIKKPEIRDRVPVRGRGAQMGSRHPNTDTAPLSPKTKGGGTEKERMKLHGA